MKSRIVFLVAVAVIACTGAFGQAPSEERKLIEQLLKRVEDLETQVRELQGKAPKAAAVSEHEHTAPGGKQVAATPTPAPGLAPDFTQPTYPTFQLRGFADIQHNSSDLKGQTN